MKTKTRKYKTKNRKTRRGGGPIIPGKTAPVTSVPATTAPANSSQVAKIDPPKSSWSFMGIFGPASKPGDKIVEAAAKLQTLLKEKNISIPLPIEQINIEAAKLT
jgi:hypothetical protein